MRDDLTKTTIQLNDDWLDRLLNWSRVRFVAMMILIVVGVLMVLSFVTVRDGITRFGSPLGGDYAAFYIVGDILNHHEAARLYDLSLQHAKYDQLRPTLAGHSFLPYAYPPFVAPLFQPLARLPYAWSFAAWLLISLLIFVTALYLLDRTFGVAWGKNRPQVWLLALSFEPFIIESWLGGQLSVLGFLFICLALFYEQRERPWLCGSALGFCCYKPTLLVLMLPLLLVGRRFRVLSGVLTTGIALAVITAWGMGVGVWKAFADRMLSYLHASVGSTTVFRTWKFVDLASFLRLLQGGQTTIGWSVFAALTLSAAILLGQLWWQAGNDQVRRRRAWASALTWTLVFNLYVGIYDTILVIPAVILTLSSLDDRDYRLLLTAVYLTPWVTQPIAWFSHVQFDTLILMAFGFYQVHQRQRAF